jgi:2-methylcitrate dehydratase PrpD
MSQTPANDESEAQEKPADAADLIAAHLARTRYADLPAAVVSAVKISILDTLGCILAGTSSADVATISSMVLAWGGAPICTVIGSGGIKQPPISAAFINGAAIHQHDFDDVHDAVTCHPTASTLVPALAAAEERKGITGRDLILAVALGSDLTCRVSRAILGAHGHPWYRAPVVGMFGATAAAAKIFGATADQFVQAFGLALPQIGGTYASLHHTGSSVRSIRDGLAFRNGLLAAEMAMRGIKGDPEVFEGKYGFYQAYYKGAYDRRRLLDGLGEDYEAPRVSLKPWPSARHLHTTMTAVLDIMTRQSLSFQDVAEVTFDVGRFNTGRCAPVTPEVQSNHIDLLGNLPFAVAATIRRGNVPIAVYLDERMIDDVVKNALPRVKWRYNPEQDGDWRFEPGRVELHTVHGQVYRALCKTALGHPDNPMSEGQRHEKFVRCVAVAARPLSEAHAGRIIELVSKLDRCEQIGQLTELIG